MHEDLVRFELHERHVDGLESVGGIVQDLAMLLLDENELSAHDGLDRVHVGHLLQRGLGVHQSLDGLVLTPLGGLPEGGVH